MKPQKIKEILLQAEKKMVDVGKRDYLVDVSWLMCHLFDCSRTELILMGEKVVAESDLNSFNEMFTRRLMGEPVQYIIGSTDFYGYRFNVNRHVLIPRFETEELVEKAIDLSKKQGFTTFIDMCCGSGCIGITLLKELPEASGYLVDLSQEAIVQTEENAQNLEVINRANIIQSNLFEQVDPIKVDMIVSNPPYIEFDEVLRLDEEVQVSEPMMALSGGLDGLDFYRRIIANAKNYLKTGGYLLFEIGYNQSDVVQKLMKHEGFQNINGYKDLSNKDRMVVGQWIE